jgi:ribosomal protein S8
MSTDIVSDVLNQLMNAKRAKRDIVVTKRYSKLLINVLELMKQGDYIDYELEDGKLKITIKDVTECRAIKPRYTVNKKTIDKYIRRFLPSRTFGFVVVSTNKGLMLHPEAQENKIGGSLIAYYY